MHPGTRKQTFFKGHSDDVMCLAVHPSGELAATGDVGAKPRVHVWRVSDGVCVATMDDVHVVAVTALAFSADGKYLASVGCDAQHTVAVHEWEANPSAALGGVFAGRLVAKEFFGSVKPYVAKFNPVDGRLVVGGNKSLKFFSAEDDALYAAPAQYAHGARKGFAQCTVLSLAFLPDGCTFGGTAKGDVYKYEEGGVRAVRRFPALHHGPIHDMAFTGKALVTGGKDGKVKLWSVFMQPMFTVDVSKVAGGLLDDHSAPRSYTQGRAPSIRALAPSADGRKLAVGTASSEIFEIDITSEAKAESKATLPMQGHAAAMDPKTGKEGGDVWGLAVHPSQPQFVTVSEDRSIRVWSLKERKMIRMARIPSKGRSVAWHPKMDHVAVGTYSGQVTVVDIVKGTTVTVVSLAKGPITAVRYSPCGKFLGVTCQDGCFRVLGVFAGQNGGYALVGTTNLVSNPRAAEMGSKASPDDAGTEAMTHVDWSEDSKHVQVNTAGGGLKFFTAPGCDTVDPKDPAVRDTDWSTWSLPYGWAAQGVWSAEAAPGDINAVARSNRGDWEEGECVLASADDYGMVRLSKYPANVGLSDFKEYNGHSANVTNCAFSASDKWLVTTGGGDRCVLVWRHSEGGPATDVDDAESAAVTAAEGKTVAADARGDGDGDSDSESDEEDNVQYEGGKSSKPVMMVQSGMEQGVAMFTPVNADDGVPNPYKNHSLAELGCRRGYRSPMTGRPALSQTHVPSWWQKDSTSYDPPSAGLKLAWAYGYRGYDTRQNVWYNSKGEIVYHTAAVGVVYNPSSETQRHITDDPESDDVAEGHSDDILCMARHPDKLTFATGEIGRTPKVVVWDSDGMKALSVMQGFHKRAVIACCFSPCGDYLASVGGDNEHSVAIYEWKTESLLATYKGDREKILGINWSPFDGTLVTTGVKHIKFVANAWTSGKAITKGTRFKPKKAVLGSKGKWQNFYTAAFVGGNVTVVGSRGGQLYVFKGTTLSQVIPKAHAGKVNAVFCLHEHNVLITGGDDGIVSFWKASDMTPLHKVRLESPALGKKPSPVNSITTDSKSKALVGTKCGEVWEISDQARILVEGHGKGEVWGLAVHPEKQRVATGGDDGTLRIWTTEPGKGRRCVERVRVVENPKPIKSSSFDTGCVRAVAFHPSGDHLAAGTVAGEVVIFNADTLDRFAMLSRPKNRDGWVSDLKFSPRTPEAPSGGRYLAVGSHDNVVDIYDSQRGYALVGTCKGHSSFIMHLGWSKDGSTLWTNSGDYELLFWNAPKGDQIRSGSDCKDVVWDGWTGTLGFEVTGVWYKGSDGTDVNCAALSNFRGVGGVEERVVATGDDRGIVSLYRAPALGGKGRTYGGHSSHVTSVRFTRDGAAMFSAGGGDSTMLQWEVEPGAGK